MIRTLIVDDEPLARKRLRSLLEPESKFSVIGEAHHGEMAVAMIEVDRPDLIFLDIQMPTMTGFEVIAAVTGRSGADAMPMTVFVTAFDEFAIKAFEVQALDYLLKPFDDIRFAQILGRVCSVHATQGERLTRLLETVPPLPRLFARSHGKTRVIGYDDIDWIAAAGDYAEVHCGDRAWLVNDAIATLADRLPSDGFARVHRSSIVCLSKIVEIRQGSHGDGILVLKSGASLRFSRRYRHAVEAWLKTGISD